MHILYMCIYRQTLAGFDAESASNDASSEPISGAGVSA